MQDYDYHVEHRAGTQMQHVDALSRYAMMTITYDDVTTKIHKAQAEDDEILKIKTKLDADTSYKEYFIKNDILYKIVNDDELLVVPCRMQAEIIKSAHERGHFA